MSYGVAHRFNMLVLSCRNNGHAHCDPQTFTLAELEEIAASLSRQPTPTGEEIKRLVEEINDVVQHGDTFDVADIITEHWPDLRAALISRQPAPGNET